MSDVRMVREQCTAIVTKPPAFGWDGKWSVWREQCRRQVLVPVGTTDPKCWQHA